jgi:Multicopper oxidase
MRRFRPRTPLPTTVHWHGVRLDNRHDGVPNVTQPLIQPGDTFTRKVKFPDAGIHWYHALVGRFGNVLLLNGEADYTLDVKKGDGVERAGMGQRAGQAQGHDELSAGARVSWRLDRRRPLPAGAGGFSLSGSSIVSGGVPLYGDAGPAYPLARDVPYGVRADRFTSSRSGVRNESPPQQQAE